MRLAEPAFLVYGLYGALQTIETHDDANGDFARSLGNRNDVDSFVRNGGEYASGETGRAAHSLPDDSQQSHVLVDSNGPKITMREFEREIGRKGLERGIDIVFANEETKTLAITGAAENQYLDIRESKRVEGAGHNASAA